MSRAQLLYASLWHRRAALPRRAADYNLSILQGQLPPDFFARFLRFDTSFDRVFWHESGRKDFSK